MTTYVRKMINNEEVNADRQKRNLGKDDKVISVFVSKTKMHSQLKEWSRA